MPQPKKTHCVRGHELTPENTVPSGKGGRTCRQCKYMRTRKWLTKKYAQTKICKRCGVEQPREKFGHNGRSVVCSDCPPWTSRDYMLDRKYRLSMGLSLREVEELVAAQGGVCEMCKKMIKGLRHVDHDHSTGKYRGVLCARCNTALPYIEDETFGIMAREYLNSR